jgi:hypothetical protein
MSSPPGDHDGFAELRQERMANTLAHVDAAELVVSKFEMHLKVLYLAVVKSNLRSTSEGSTFQTTDKQAECSDALGASQVNVADHGFPNAACPGALCFQR